MSRVAADALARNIEAAHSVARKAALTPQQRVWLAQIMTIWTCAYLEHTFRTRVLEYSSQGSDEATANYVRNQIQRVRNPSVMKMCEVLGRFNAGWKERFRENAGEPMLDSITSIVQQRNRIAHGEQTDITVRQIYAHFLHVRTLGEVLATVLVASKRTQIQEV